MCHSDTKGVVMMRNIIPFSLGALSKSTVIDGDAKISSHPAMWIELLRKLPAIVLCSTISLEYRRAIARIYGMEVDDKAIDYSRNGIIMGPPGVGKTLLIPVDALSHFAGIVLVVPTVLQAEYITQTLNRFYGRGFASCKTSMHKGSWDSRILIVTQGILHKIIQVRDSEIWQRDAFGNYRYAIFVDEAHTILDSDPVTDLFLGYYAKSGGPVFLLSATLNPGKLPDLYARDEVRARVYEVHGRLFPVSITCVRADTDYLKLLRDSGRQYPAPPTTLLICSSRKQVHTLAELIKSSYKQPKRVVQLTGAHMLEETVAELLQSDKDLNKRLFIVATVDVMSGVVTIPNLRIIILSDQYAYPEYNRFGYIESCHGSLSSNQIRQIIGRIGRIAPIDGIPDRVYVATDDFALEHNLNADFPSHDPIVGVEQWYPFEKVLLQAFSLGVKPEEVHSYMNTSIPIERVSFLLAKMLDDGVIRRLNDNDYGLTELGVETLKLPFEYAWSYMIALINDPIIRYLFSVGAAFQDASSFDMFNSPVATYPWTASSGFLRMIKLGLTYMSKPWEERKKFESRYGLSVRRLEQSYQVLCMACAVMDLDELNMPTVLTNLLESKLLATFVIKGIDIGLIDLFAIRRSEHNSMSEGRIDSDTVRVNGDYMQIRWHTLPFKSDVNITPHFEGIVFIAGVPSLFYTSKGTPHAVINLETRIPAELVSLAIDSYVRRKQNLVRVIFTHYSERLYLGNVKKEWLGHGVNDGDEKTASYVLSPKSPCPEVGREYWCFIEGKPIGGKSFVRIWSPVISKVSN